MSTKILAKNLPWILGTVLGLSVFIVYFSVSSEAYKHGPSSVGSSLGLAFLPFETLFYAVPTFIFGLSLGYFIKWLMNKTKLNLKMLLSAIVISGFTYYFILPIFPLISANKTVSHIQEMNTQELEAAALYYQQHKDSKYTPFFFGAIVNNPRVDPETLHQISLMNDPILYKRMWSPWGLMGKNKKGIAVMRMIISNPKVQLKTIETLAASNDDYVLEDIARNKNTPVKILRNLYEKEKGIYGLALNPHTPSDILVGLAQKESNNRYILSTIEKNPNTPPDLLPVLQAKIKSMEENFQKKYNPKSN